MKLSGACSGQFSVQLRSRGKRETWGSPLHTPEIPVIVDYSRDSHFRNLYAVDDPITFGISSRRFSSSNSGTLRPAKCEGDFVPSRCDPSHSGKTSLAR